MNNLLLLILSWILASCGMPVSGFSQDNPVSIISAEKKEWSGGRSGVKGVIYTIQLKTKNNISIKSLKAEGHMIPFTRNILGKIIVIQGSFQYKNNNDATVEDMPTGASTENLKQNVNLKESWIEYTLKNSNASQRISISKFNSIETHEELVP